MQAVNIGPYKPEVLLGLWMMILHQVEKKQYHLTHPVGKRSICCFVVVLHIRDRFLDEDQLNALCEYVKLNAPEHVEDVEWDYYWEPEEWEPRIAWIKAQIEGLKFIIQNPS